MCTCECMQLSPHMYISSNVQLSSSSKPTGFASRINRLPVQPYIVLLSTQSYLNPILSNILASLANTHTHKHKKLATIEPMPDRWCLIGMQLNQLNLHVLLVFHANQRTMQLVEIIIQRSSACGIVRNCNTRLKSLSSDS